MILDSLLDQTDIVALTVTQALEPMEGPGVPIFPATYPAPSKGGSHRHGTPYTINELRNGTRVATLDSVQSQANRLEAAFHGELARYVPQVTVTAGERTLALTELPHRLADAAVRASELGGEIRAAFEAYERGDPLPVARLSPASLIFGAWDSRDTRIRIPRLVRSEIHAWDVDIFTRSAQFSGAFEREDLGLTETEWKKGAEIGFAPTPSIDQHGGVLVHGAITQTATVHIGTLRQLDRAAPGLGPYLLGLTLAALWTGGREYSLRTGCWLLPKGPAQIHTVGLEGQRTPVELDRNGILSYLQQQDEPARTALGIPLGAEPRSVKFDPAAGKRLIKEKDKHKDD